MSLTIRRAVLSDAADMADILSRSWTAAYTEIIPDAAIAEKNAGRFAMFQKVLSAENGNYIAFNNETPTGLIMLSACRDDGLEGLGEVGAFYLNPDFWGRGFGRGMMDFAVKTLAEQGFSPVVLWVLEKNMRARRFYERYGYRLDNVRKEIVIGKPLIEVRYRLDTDSG